MRYSEYLQLRDLLDENGISWEDFKKDPQLYEGVLSAIGKGLWNLAKKGMKSAVSKGISANKKEQLNKAAESIRTWILEEVKKGKENKTHPLYNILTKKDEYKKLLTNKKQKSQEEKDAIKSIRGIDRELSKFLRKKVDSKVKVIEQKISKNEHITDDDKELLQQYWDDLSINLEISIAEALSDAGIISDEGVEDIFTLIAGEQRMRGGGKTPPAPSKKSKEPVAPTTQK